MKRSVILAAVVLIASLAVASAVKPGRRLMVEDDEQRKSEWPELVGLAVEDAKALLEAEGISKVQVVPEGSMVTMDWNEERVRLFASEGKVSQVPRRG
eukprot:tig00000237_g20458.t1